MVDVPLWYVTEHRLESIPFGAGVATAPIELSERDQPFPRLDRRVHRFQARRDHPPNPILREVDGEVCLLVNDVRTIPKFGNVRGRVGRVDDIQRGVTLVGTRNAIPLRDSRILSVALAAGWLDPLIVVFFHMSKDARVDIDRAIQKLQAGDPLSGNEVAAIWESDYEPSEDEVT